MPTTTSRMTQPSRVRRSHHEWTEDEHARYLESLQLFPDGPWRLRAAYVGTRTTRQLMTHFQKIRQRQERHKRGLRPSGRPRGGDATLSQRNGYREISVPPLEAFAIARTGHWTHALCPTESRAMEPPSPSCGPWSWEDLVLLSEIVGVVYPPS